MSEELTVDSGFDGESVVRAELFWANLPTRRKWTVLATHEKALVVHTIARALGEMDAIVKWLREQPPLVEVSPECVLTNTPKMLANAIERGDHLRGVGKGNG